MLANDAELKSWEQISKSILEASCCNCAVIELDNEVARLERKYVPASPNANLRGECFPSQCLEQQNMMAVYSSRKNGKKGAHKNGAENYAASNYFYPEVATQFACFQQFSRKSS